MTNDRVEALRALLVRTEAAHGEFETTELNGVYDRDWPRWYAAHAVEHGIAGLIGHPVSTDRLAEFLSSTWAEFERSDPRSSDAWPAYTARRIAAEL